MIHRKFLSFDLVVLITKTKISQKIGDKSSLYIYSVLSDTNKLALKRGGGGGAHPPNKITIIVCYMYIG